MPYVIQNRDTEKYMVDQFGELKWGWSQFEGEFDPAVYDLVEVPEPCNDPMDPDQDPDAARYPVPRAEWEERALTKSEQFMALVMEEAPEDRAELYQLDLVNSVRDALAAEDLETAAVLADQIPGEDLKQAVIEITAP